VAEKAFKNILSLPLHPGMSDGDVNRVCDSITRFYRK
jgi:dTDP-4-amino-4,6-dideoxygalactose transaminase